MCGIFGYVGARQAFPLIADGLRRLEYRGYDSAGVAVLEDGRIERRRALGRVDSLVANRSEPVPDGTVGIGHTRWATHGKPSVANAHPHVDCTGTVAVVHNGIIENHKALREWLITRGHVFHSDTDTEVVPHLIEEYAGGDVMTTLRKVMEVLVGEYALAVLTSVAPDAVIVARAGTPPLAIGVGDGEHLVASDVLALAAQTRVVLPLDESELALVTATGAEIVTARGGRAHGRAPLPICWEPAAAERGAHAHYMHKEIHEQPSAIRRTLARPAVSADGERGTRSCAAWWRDVGRLTLVGCGTSYHAGLVGRRFFESFARIPSDVDIASEFRMRELLPGAGDACVFISQSGETADTLGAVRAAEAQGSRILGVCNVPGSSLTRAAHTTLLTDTGPEIGVASTKAFTAQLVALFLLALEAGRARGFVDDAREHSLLAELHTLPSRMEQVLGEETRVADLAALCHGARSFFFLGRGLFYPIALEGALKLKEIAYVPAEAFAAGEMKHGPLALIDPATVTVALAPAGPTHARMASTIEEVKARGGKVVAVCSAGDDATPGLADWTLSVPSMSEPFSAPLLALPLQLFAYHVALLAGHDVDRPRNLAKSVTVE